MEAFVVELEKYDKCENKEWNKIPNGVMSSILELENCGNGESKPIVLRLILAFDRYAKREKLVMNSGEPIIKPVASYLAKQHTADLVPSWLKFLTSKAAYVGIKMILIAALARLENAHEIVAYFPDMVWIGGKVLKGDTLARVRIVQTMDAMVQKLAHTTHGQQVMKLIFGKALGDKAVEVRCAAVVAITKMVEMKHNGFRAEYVWPLVWKMVDGETMLHPRKLLGIAVGKLLVKFWLEKDVLKTADAEENVDDEHCIGVADKEVELKAGGYKLPKMLRKKSQSLGFNSLDEVLVFVKNSVWQENRDDVGAMVVATILEQVPVDMIVTEPIITLVLSFISACTMEDCVRRRISIGFVLRHGLSCRLTEEHRYDLYSTLLVIAQNATEDYHITITLFVEIGHLIAMDGDAAGSHVESIEKVAMAALGHEKHAVRMAAGNVLTCVGHYITVHRSRLVGQCMTSLRNYATSALVEQDNVSSDVDRDKEYRRLLYFVHGCSNCIAQIVQDYFMSNLIEQQDTSLPFEQLRIMTNDLLRPSGSSKCPGGVFLTLSRGGWRIASSLFLGEQVWTLEAKIIFFQLLQSDCAPRKVKDSGQEYFRLEASLLALLCYVQANDLIINTVVGIRVGIVAILQKILEVIVQSYESATPMLALPTTYRGKSTLTRVCAYVFNCFYFIPSKYYLDSVGLLLELVTDHLGRFALDCTLEQEHIDTYTRRSSLLENLLNKDDDAVSAMDPCYLDSSTPLTQSTRDCLSPYDSFLVMLQREYVLTDLELEGQFYRNAECKSFFDLQRRRATSRGCSEKSRVSRNDQRPISAISVLKITDCSALLFSHLLPSAPTEIQQKSLQQLAQSIISGSDAIRYNIATTMFIVAETVSSGKEFSAPALRIIHSILLAFMADDEPLIRRATAEAFGLFTLQAGLFEEWTTNLVSSLEQSSENLSGQITFISGGMLALACAKRQNPGKGVSNDNVLYKYAGETQYPLSSFVLHGWSLVIESMYSNCGFQAYIESTKGVVKAHVLAGVKYSTKTGGKWLLGKDLCLVQLANSVISSLGPELTNHTKIFHAMKTVWSIILDRHRQNFFILLEYWKYIESITLFAPTALNIVQIVDMANFTLLNTNVPIRVVTYCACTVRLLIERLDSELKAYFLDFFAIILRALHRCDNNRSTALPSSLYFGFSCSKVGASVLSSGKCMESDLEECYAELEACLLSLVEQDAIECRDTNPCFWILLLRDYILSGNCGDRLKTAYARKFKTSSWRGRVICATIVLHLFEKLFKPGNKIVIKKLNGSMDKGQIFAHSNEVISLACYCVSFTSHGCGIIEMQLVGVRLLQHLLLVLASTPDPQADPGSDVLFLAQYQAQITSSLKVCFNEPNITGTLFHALFEATSHVICENLVADPTTVHRLAKNVLKVSERIFFDDAANCNFNRKAHAIMAARMYATASYVHEFAEQYSTDWINMLMDYASETERMPQEHLSLRQSDTIAIVAYALISSKIHLTSKCTMHGNPVELAVYVLIAHFSLHINDPSKAGKYAKEEMQTVFSAFMKFMELPWDSTINLALYVELLNVTRQTTCKLTCMHTIDAAANLKLAIVQNTDVLNSIKRVQGAEFLLNYIVPIENRNIPDKIIQKHLIAMQVVFKTFSCEDIGEFANSLYGCLLKHVPWSITSDVLVTKIASLAVVVSSLKQLNAVAGSLTSIMFDQAQMKIIEKVTMQISDSNISKLKFLFPLIFQLLNCTNNIRESKVYLDFNRALVSRILKVSPDREQITDLLQTLLEILRSDNALIPTARPFLLAVIIAEFKEHQSLKDPTSSIPEPLFPSLLLAHLLLPSEKQNSVLEASFPLLEHGVVQCNQNECTSIILEFAKAHPGTFKNAIQTAEHREELEVSVRKFVSQQHAKPRKSHGLKFDASKFH